MQFTIPTISEIQDKVQQVFQRRPCEFQSRAALAILARKPLILIGPTGAGKTLPFWIPVIFNNGGNYHSDYGSQC
ncbi:MAG TPA: hypothetical protein VGO47_01730, partial [Chlamydiales bacterium]|nr:hypothetical protein [Chlamydiales bacterium]